MNKILFVMASVLVTACAQKPVLQTSNITSTPDLSAYKSLSLTSNSSGERTVYQTQYFSDSATLITTNKDGIASHLIIQPNRCRNSAEPGCERRFAIVGDLSVTKDLRVSCFVELRNDVNEGYYGQAIQGICRDRNSRTYQATFAR